MKIGAERCKNNSTLRKGSAKLPKKYRRSASKFFCILQFDPCVAEINKHPFQMFKPNKLDKSADKNALSNHCIHTNTAKLAIATKFLTGIFDEAQYWNIAKRQMVCGKDQRSLAQKMSKRSELENDWTCWKCSFLDFQICQNRISSTMRLSFMSIHSSIEQRHRICFIFMPWPNRWEMAMNKRKQSAEIKRSATHRKVNMLRQRDNCWGQRRVEMTWRYYFGTMPQNSHSTNKRSRILVALSIWGSSSIRWGRQSSTP